MFSGTIFYSLLIVASRRSYPFKVEVQERSPFFEPLVYVLIPAHNEESVIEITARTVLNQDYHNFKLFLINDNSTDSTREIMERIASENPKKITVIDVPPERGGRSKPRASTTPSK